MQIRNCRGPDRSCRSPTQLHRLDALQPPHRPQSVLDSSCSGTGCRAFASSVTLAGAGCPFIALRGNTLAGLIFPATAGYFRARACCCMNPRQLRLPRIGVKMSPLPKCPRLHTISLEPAFCCNFPERDLGPASAEWVNSARLIDLTSRPDADHPGDADRVQRDSRRSSTRRGAFMLSRRTVARPLGVRPAICPSRITK